jgi:hypothetical protein
MHKPFSNRTKSPRLRFRLSIRALMILVLIIGGCFGWATHEIRSARARRDAVAAIKADRYSVLYDWQWKEGRFVGESGVPPWPKWLVSAVGIDLLSQPVWVDLAHPYAFFRMPPGTADGALLSRLACLERLESLDLRRNFRLTDADLVHLRGMTRLRELRLGMSGVRGPGLAHLRSLTRLESLYLLRMPLSDDDLAPIAGLRSLRRLTIHAPVTAAALGHLSGLTGLRELYIKSNAITDEGLADAASAGLGRMTGLRRFHITSSRVSSKGLAALRASLPNLVELKHEERQ